MHLYGVHTGLNIQLAPLWWSRNTVCISMQLIQSDRRTRWQPFTHALKTTHVKTIDRKLIKKRHQCSRRFQVRKLYGRMWGWGWGVSDISAPKPTCGLAMPNACIVPAINFYSNGWLCCLGIKFLANGQWRRRGGALASPCLKPLGRGGANNAPCCTPKSKLEWMYLK